METMGRFAWRELKARGGRSAALGLAVVIGATGFTVLTASSQAQRLDTVGQVNAASQQAFDILVRPKGSRLPAERAGRLVAPGYLNGLSGISVNQWQEIANLAGVQVAAPIAIVGFMTPYIQAFVDLTRYASRRGPTTFRVDGTWRLPDGSTLRQRPRYVLTAAESVGGRTTESKPAGSGCGPALGPIRPGSTVTTVAPSVWCFFAPPTRSEVEKPRQVGHVGAYQPVPIPILVAAIDPGSEADLFGLDEAAEVGALKRLHVKSNQRGDRVPMVMSERTPVRASLVLRVSILPNAASRQILQGRNLRPLRNAPRKFLLERRIGATDAYNHLKSQLKQYEPGEGYEGRVFQYWSVSQPVFKPQGGTLRAVPVGNNLKKLWVDGSDFSVAPAGTNDVSFRMITLHRRFSLESGVLGDAPALVSVGTYQPGQLPNQEDLVSELLAGFATAPTKAADASSRAALGDDDVPVSTNIADLVQPPPLMLMDLRSLPKLTGATWNPSTSAAPLSAIRVQVKGVTGVDELSRERVRLVAQRIRERTGLDVDITVGSSATDKTLVEPAGKFGRPRLVLRQTWVKLGVAVEILRALDKKSLVLFVLVLLVSGLTVTNSAVASIRSRRTQLGVLACLGWSRASLFRLVLTELLIVAFLSGACAFLLSMLLATMSGIDVSILRAALAWPAAALVTLLAGLSPAVAATRVTPLEAVHPSVVSPRRVTTVRSTTALARSNLRRVPSRAVLAAAGLTVATTTFTLLLALALGFQGAVVGSVLGDAVAIAARGPDYAAAAATLLLAGLGIANLTYLNIRERAPELATLAALGWKEHKLLQLLLIENLFIGALGGVSGAMIGYLGTWLLVRDLPSTVLLGAAFAAMTAILLAAFATLLSTVNLGRLPITQLLTE